MINNDCSIITDKINSINNNEIVNSILDNRKYRNNKIIENNESYSNINIEKNPEIPIIDKTNNISDINSRKIIKDKENYKNQILNFELNDISQNKALNHSDIIPHANPIELNKQASINNSKYKISYFDFLKNVLFFKKPSQKNLRFESVKEFLAEKSSIDIILRSFLSFELIKKLILDKEEYLNLQNLELYDENYLVENP